MNRNLSLLLFGQLASQIGDKFHMLAVAFLVLQTTGSAAQMGLVLFCSIFPGMALGVVSGAFVDRFNRKALIIGADLARGLIVAVLCAAFYLEILSFPFLLAAQCAISVCTAFFDPAVPAIIPQIVPPEKLSQANSRTQLVSGISMIAGPALGGLAVAWNGYLFVFVVNACSYLFSAGMEAFITLPPHDRKGLSTAGVLGDIHGGCKYLFGKRSLVLILGMVGLIHFLVGSIEVIIPILAVQIDGAGPENMGRLQAAFGAGTICAGLVLGLKSIAGRESSFLFGGASVIGLLLIGVSLALHLGVLSAAPYLFLFAGVGCCVICAATGFRSLIQQKTETAMMGRVFGFASSVGNVSIPLAALVYGVLLERYALGLVAAVTGVVLTPICILGGFLFYRAPSNVNLYKTSQ
ncbi:Predicted arabinose efflux permease, MFS family [Desulfatibacillum alkenivorans DSM 16219]|uniref:Predicted arabinose efflux permease, MFS family n=1 Tax=Desulfatibacillum alkenivorans DSM 16219 TaxID=1121393 RepID=A0A1M6LUL7_9BACT|nr:MFS transporter [Desulfatibacillum alkenivorans]SHJ74937.1 Predicted arabinose efflux permease, MFS family [Desulfatibacillum alkenivorans DSM 16219]